MSVVPKVSNSSQLPHTTIQHGFLGYLKMDLAHQTTCPTISPLLQQELQPCEQF